MRRVILALHAGFAFAILLHAGILSAAGLMTAREQGALLWEAGISGEQVRPPQSQFIDDIEKTIRRTNPGKDFESLRRFVPESAIRNFRIRQGFKGRLLSQYEAQAAIDYSQSLLRESPGKTLSDRIKVLPSQQLKALHGNVAELAESRARGLVLTKSRLSPTWDLTEPKPRPQNYQMKIYAQRSKAISSILKDFDPKYDFNKRGILTKDTLEYGVKTGRLRRIGNNYQPIGRPDVTLEPSRVFSRPAESHLYAKTGRNVLIEQGSFGNAVPNTVKWLGRAGVITLLATETYIIHRFATGQMTDREFATTQGVIVVGGLGAWGGALVGWNIGTPLGIYGKITGLLMGGIIGSIIGADISVRVASGYYGRLDTEQKRQVDESIFKYYGVNP